jgi:cytochrome c biogenesis protein CcmG/thiol:disulfide interchange protein DsbE
LTAPLDIPAEAPEDALSGRPHRIVLWLALSAGAAALILVAVLATRPPATSGQADSPLLGQPAPAIRGTSLDGRSVDLASMRGHFVLVNFFASWCAPCHQEAPSLQTLSSSVQLLGVVYDDSTGSARQFLAATGATWPAVADSSGTLAVTYGVRAPPESYLISPDGTVVAKVVGAVTGSQVSYLRSVMAKTLRSGQ